MNEQYRKIHNDLGFGFDHYVVEHLDWPLLEQLPEGALIVFQIDDPGFNAWSVQFAEDSRRRDDDPNRPHAIVNVPTKLPIEQPIPWEKAQVSVKRPVSQMPVRQPK